MEVQGPRDLVDRMVPTLAATSRWIMIEQTTAREVPVEPEECSFRVTG